MAMLVPTGAAEELATAMLNDEQTHRELLGETLSSLDAGQLLEAGRSVCESGATWLPAAQRSPRSVDLSYCPAGSTGIFHTHVTVGELSRAQHSLPDFANVWLGPVETSVVVGAETSEAALSATAPERARQRFSELIGYEVYEPADVVALIEEGMVDADAARRRVQRGMGGLVRDRSTYYPDVLERIAQAPIPHRRGPGAGSQAFTPRQPVTTSNAVDDVGQQFEFEFEEAVGPDVARLREQSRELVEVLSKATGNTRVRDVAVSAIFSTIVDEVLIKRIIA